jgi:site-specific recombinase XerD
MSEQFHYCKPEYGQASLQRAQQSGQLTAEDCQLIQQFILELHASRGTSVLRQNKFTFSLVFWRKFLPDYTHITSETLFFGISNFRLSISSRGQPYSQNSIHDHIVQLKRFLIWLLDEGHIHTNLSRAHLDKIKPPKIAKKDDLANEILTITDIKKIISACKDTQYRALISVLYEGALRSGEVACLTWDSTEWHTTHVSIRTDHKTGKRRYIPLVKSKKYLEKWKKKYPGTPSGKNLVFISDDGSPINYSSLRRIIDQYVTQAGIERKVTLHTFRHSRLTQLIKQGVCEQVIKKIAWGDTKSKMLETYTHLSNEDINEIVGKKYGIEPEKPKITDSIVMWACPSCRLLYQVKRNYCGRCGYPTPEMGISPETFEIIKTHFPCKENTFDVRLLML